MAAAKTQQSREADLRKRAAARGYTIEKDGNVWYAAIAGTRFGPMDTLDEVDAFLPASDDDIVDR